MKHKISFDNKETHKSVSIKIDSDLWRQIKKYAADKDATISYVVKDMLSEGLKQYIK